MESAVTYAALIGAVGAILSVLKFWLDFNDRVEKVKENGNVQIAALHNSFAIFREQMARERSEYITHEVLLQFESRIAANAKENTDRLTKAIEHVGDRVDQAILGRAAKR
jgi:hypothetical protein